MWRIVVFTVSCTSFVPTESSTEPAPEPSVPVTEPTEPTPTGTSADTSPTADTSPPPPTYCTISSPGPGYGYAHQQGVDGGIAHCDTPTVVTTDADKGPGSLRAALGSDRYVVFDPSLKGAQIRLDTDIVAAGLSNLTLDGRASDGTPLGVRISDRSVKLDGPDNVVISYIGFVGNDAAVDTDALTIRGNGANAARVLVAHNRFHNAADGALDIIWNRGFPMWVTVSANSFTCNDKTVLVGTFDPDEESLERYHLTFAENWFHKNLQRMPLVRNADLHYVNNVITDMANGGKGLTPDADAAVLAEDNAVASGDGKKGCRGDANGRRFILVNGPNAAVTERDTLYVDGGTGLPFNEDDQGDAFVKDALVPPYSYTRVPMDTARMAAVQAHAGY